MPCGVSVKISEEMNNRIRDEIYLPESSRKHMTNGWAGSIANSKEEDANNGFSRLHHSKADRSLLRQDDSDSDLTDLFASKIGMILSGFVTMGRFSSHGHTDMQRAI